MPGNIPDVPLAVLNSWPEANYINPTRRSWLLPFIILWQIAASVLVAIRIFVRARHQAGSLGLDDAFIVFGWVSGPHFYLPHAWSSLMTDSAQVFATALTATAIVQCVDYGIELHTWDVPRDTFAAAALTTWLDFLWAVASTTCTKISVLLFHRRLVHSTFNRTWTILIWSAIAVTVAYCIVCILALFLVCQPLEAYWMSYDFGWEAEYHCSDGVWINYFIGIVSVLSDTYAVLLPFGMVGKSDLQISRRQKLGLYMLFGFGLVVVAAGVARAYWLVQLGTQYDASWVGGNLLVWQVIEMQLALMCASAPPLRKFARHYVKGPMDKLFGSAGTGSKDAKGSLNLGSDDNGTGQETIRLHQIDRGGCGKGEIDVDNRRLRQSSDSFVHEHNLPQRSTSPAPNEKGHSSWLAV